MSAEISTWSTCWEVEVTQLSFQNKSIITFYCEIHFDEYAVALVASRVAIW